MFSPSRREQALGKGRVMMDGVSGWGVVDGGLGQCHNFCDFILDKAQLSVLCSCCWPFLTR